MRFLLNDWFPKESRLTRESSNCRRRDPIYLTALRKNTKVPSKELRLFPISSQGYLDGGGLYTFPSIKASKLDIFHQYSHETRGRVASWSTCSAKKGRKLQTNQWWSVCKNFSFWTNNNACYYYSIENSLRDIAPVILLEKHINSFTKVPRLASQ